MTTTPTAHYVRHVPVPEDTDFRARDPMWFAYGTGDDRPRVPQAPPGMEHDETTSPALPPTGDHALPLPHGTVELLERAPFPHGRARAGQGRDDGTGGGPYDPAGTLGHALTAVFGLQRTEPENPFNDHRAYPSVRAKFPVHVIVGDGDGARVLDVYRHRLAELPHAAGAARPFVALAGRYTRLPPVYQWFRGSLVNLELGINLRMLATGLELFGLAGTLRLPGAGTETGAGGDGNAESRIGDLGLAPASEWSLPLVVELDTEPGRPARAPAPAPSRTPEPAHTDGQATDPVLDQILAVNRAQRFDDPYGRLDTTVPALPADDERAGLSWAEALWQRSSGRMPRGLYGMNGRRRRLPAAVLERAVRWCMVPPPAGVLRDVWAHIRTTVVVQEVDGTDDGVHRATADGVRLHRADGTAARRLEEGYGYPLAPGNGCDVRHASMLWFFSMKPRDIVDRFGPGGWSAAQYACGWAAQGISFAAAGDGLYARPVRAFREAPAVRVLELDPDEMITFSVITGTPRTTGMYFDLRP